MERPINTLWCLCGDLSLTLADKLLLGAGAKSEPYVEFVSSTAMTITPKYTNSGVTLQYSLDSSTWTTIATGATTPSSNIIYFRGQATETKALFTESTFSNTWTFTGATNLECSGKLDRLLQNTLGSDINVLTIGDYCYDSMFYGCTSLIIAPALPATTLSICCYTYMFYGCTSLVTAPALPATTLASFCYNSMFYGCTSLKLSETMTGIYDTAYRIPTAGTGTTTFYDLTDMFLVTGGTFTGTPTINTTYYTENTPV